MVKELGSLGTLDSFTKSAPTEIRIIALSMSCMEHYASLQSPGWFEQAGWSMEGSKMIRLQQLGPVFHSGLCMSATRAFYPSLSPQVSYLRVLMCALHHEALAPLPANIRKQ
eukprot:2582974-Amphidinium_carterae.1